MKSQSIFKTSFYFMLVSAWIITLYTIVVRLIMYESWKTTNPNWTIEPTKSFAYIHFICGNKKFSFLKIYFF